MPPTEVCLYSCSCLSIDWPSVLSASLFCLFCIIFIIVGRFLIMNNGLFADWDSCLVVVLPGSSMAFSIFGSKEPFKGLFCCIVMNCIGYLAVAYVGTYCC